MRRGPKRLDTKTLELRGSPWAKQRQRRGELTNIRIPARPPAAVKNGEIIELQISKDDKKLFLDVCQKMNISVNDFLLSYIPPSDLLRPLLNLHKGETSEHTFAVEYFIDGQRLKSEVQK